MCVVCSLFGSVGVLLVVVGFVCVGGGGFWVLLGWCKVY